MKLKKLVALLLCAAVMLPLAACVKKPDSGTSRTSQTTDDTTVTPTKDGDTSITATDKGNKGAAAQDLMQGITPRARAHPKSRTAALRMSPHRLRLIFSRMNTSPARTPSFRLSPCSPRSP